MDKKILLEKVQTVSWKLEQVIKPELLDELLEIERFIKAEDPPISKRKQNREELIEKYKRMYITQKKPRKKS